MMTRRIFKISVLLTSLFVVCAVQGETTVSSLIKLPAPRWMYDPSQKIQGNNNIKNLALMKQQALNKDWSACLSSYGASAKAFPELRPWIARQRLLCALQIADKKKKAVDLRASIQIIKVQPDWLLSGPFAEPLKRAYIEGLTQLFSLQLMGPRSTAWSTFETLSAFDATMTNNQKSEAYRVAGELSYLDQDLSKSLTFFEKSLQAVENKKTAERRDLVRSQIEAREKPKAEPIPAPAPTPEVPPVLLSEKETEMQKRIEDAVKSKDFVAVVEDGVDLLNQFPGGIISDWAADQILRVYLSVASQRKEEFRMLQTRMVKQMAKADPERMLRWAVNAYWRGWYQDALSLSETAAEKFQGQSSTPRALLFAGKSAYYSGGEKAALQHFATLAEKFSGTLEAEEGLFFIGLSHLKRQKWLEAATQFERLLGITKSEKWTYRGLYWYWRALQKTNSEKSVEIAQRLKKEFPITYYGLRAHAELNANRLVLENPEKFVEPKLSLVEGEKKTFERYKMLLQAGWLEEAQTEISGLTAPISPGDKIVMARLYAFAADYFTAITLTREAWSEDPSQLTRSHLEIVFPREFSGIIKKSLKGTAFNEDLVSSLIRQESSFRTAVVSGAGARGLMQLMLPTARDLLTPAEKKTYSDDKLFDPSVNIRLGSRYLQRLNRNFKGNVPLKLAAYNAGIGRLRRWLASRPETADMSDVQSSDAMQEIWFDELPWDETSDYVKSILRNYLIYQALPKGELVLNDPMWAIKEPNAESGKK